MVTSKSGRLWAGNRSGTSLVCYLSVVVDDDDGPVDPLDRTGRRRVDHVAVKEEPHRCGFAARNEPPVRGAICSALARFVPTAGAEAANETYALDRTTLSNGV